MKNITGQYIIANEYNKFFCHVSVMLLEYFDTPEYDNCVFILGSYIVFDIAFFRNMYPNRKIIIYQLEPLFGTGGAWVHPATIINNIRGADYIWDMDKMNAKYLEWHGIIVDKIQPMLYTKALEYAIDPVEPDIDVLFYGGMNARRADIISSIQHSFTGWHQITVIAVLSIEPDKLIDYMSRSKIILNLHVAEPYNRQEQVRIFYALINSKCVVSETSQINHFGHAIVECETNALAASLIHLIQNDTWKEVGANGYKLFKNQQLGAL